MRICYVVFLAVFLTACVDYVNENEDEYDDLRNAQELAILSSSSAVESIGRSSSDDMLSVNTCETSSWSSNQKTSNSATSLLMSSSSSNKISSPDLNISSNMEESSSSETADGAWIYLNPNIRYGELVDSRDGQIYKTVVIGKQTWMAQNLNYEYNKGSAVCYNIKKRNIYGLLYTWAAAMDSVNSECGYGKQCSAGFENHETGICPDGWRLPNYEDWEELYRFAKVNCEGDDLGTCLTSRELWLSEIQGTDRLGFSALPAGEGRETPNLYGFRAYFWSSTEWGETGAYTPYFGYDQTIFNWAVHTKNYGFSIRCIKDEPHESVNDPSIGSLYHELGQELIDLRDNRVYRTTNIGSKIWMAENLNYDDVSSICYEYSLDSCSLYGRLYQWHTAMGVSKDVCGKGHICNSNNGKVQGVCPGGWHLPSKEEWSELLDDVGGANIAGAKLKATRGWAEFKNGEDYNNFRMKPSGDKDLYGFSPPHYQALIWTSSEHSADSSFYVVFSIYSHVSISQGDKAYYVGIRCVKDDF